jgi:pimeloyl-ACP methyl ester carboxylesterase
MTTFVLVHGATGGGWIWRQVSLLLRTKGVEVYTPTLTGLGECAHLLSPEFDLDTHIQDVVNVMEYEGLSEVILVGHSYGGMVITGVAERIPQRLAHLVYLDAYVPEDGESAMDLYGAAFVDAVIEWVQTQGDGWRYPPRQRKDPRSTDHPFRTLVQPVAVRNLAAAALPHTYIPANSWPSV